ncbi:MAG: TIGR03618 family F420-dependent PPOX class oxidoreductase [Nocardioidaceae bacterium]|nr:TIGR03618 family F420-dependent PPOX class oxidoreductase [Nocardioidaceae bacterium]MCL2614539.1 TIGR03618 family F420-dependent PPOX class oxidoreductase [Nocardioidaceae bacterium]
MTSIRELVPASHHDLLDARWATALVTLDAQGRPHTTAVWYLADDEDGRLKISLSDARVKFKHLSANPEAGLLIVDPSNQFHTLEVRGTVTLAADDDKAVATKVGAKYDADIADFDQPGDKRYTAVITPRKVVTNG